jgi:chorismate-pyruvate lyase
VYPELKKLRERGYSLKVLVRVLEEKGVVCRNLNQRALNLPDESGTNKRRDGAKSGL